MDRQLPDREQLLSDVFDLVREHQPVNDAILLEKLNEKYEDAGFTAMSIALCMLQGRGLVEHFMVEVDPDAPRRRNRPKDVESKYRIIEQTPEPPEEIEKPGFWSRLFG